MKKIIKKVFGALGIEVRKVSKTPKPLDFISHLNIQTVLDIGANIGEFSTEIRKYIPKDAKIFAFEPLVECFAKLNKNLVSDKNFKSFQFALGEKEEKLEINKSAYAPSSSLIEMADVHKEAFPHTTENSKETILVKRLDDLKEKDLWVSPILIKIDVQGFEDKVIAGGRATFEKTKIVFIENSFFELYKGQLLFDDMNNLLKSLGFKYAGSLSRKYHPKTGRILFEDSIFIKD